MRIANARDGLALIEAIPSNPDRRNTFGARTGASSSKPEPNRGTSVAEGHCVPVTVTNPAFRLALAGWAGDSSVPNGCTLGPTGDQPSPDERDGFGCAALACTQPAATIATTTINARCMVFILPHGIRLTRIQVRIFVRFVQRSSCQNMKLGGQNLQQRAKSAAIPDCPHFR
jgi:hypothetical protein